MRRAYSLVPIKVMIFLLGLFLLTAAAMPGYLKINKQNEANLCKTNQVLVETALAVKYAENLANGVHSYPSRLTPDMFADGKIPTCPIDGKPIQFDPETGRVSCPNHIHSHSWDVESD